MFESIDTSGNGTVSFDEFAAWSRQVSVYTCGSCDRKAATTNGSVLADSTRGAHGAVADESTRPVQRNRAKDVGSCSRSLESKIAGFKLADYSWLTSTRDCSDVGLN